MIEGRLDMDIGTDLMLRVLASTYVACFPCCSRCCDDLHVACLLRPQSFREVQPNQDIASHIIDAVKYNVRSTLTTNRELEPSKVQTVEDRPLPARPGPVPQPFTGANRLDAHLLVPDASILDMLNAILGLVSLPVLPVRVHTAPILSSVSRLQTRPALERDLALLEMRSVVLACEQDHCEE